TSARTVITKTVSVSSASRIVCDFDYLRQDEVAIDGDRNVFLSYYVKGASNAQDFLEAKEEVSDGILYVLYTGVDGGTNETFPPTFPRVSVPGKWVHVTVDLTFGSSGASPGTVGGSSLTRDGTVLKNMAPLVVSSSDVRAVTINIGLAPIWATKN